MALPTERSEGVSFPRPLPHPGFFLWATWVGACGLAYWSYVAAARGGVSVLLSIGFWAFALVVIPIIATRNRERTTAPVMTALLTLLAYVLLMQDALR
jgi:hypothetical protein